MTINPLPIRGGYILAGVNVEWDGETFRAVRISDDGIVTLCRSTDKGGATAYVGINRLAAHEQHAIYRAPRSS